MGLLRGMARTAVVAGTATAVSNRVSRRQARRWSAEEAPQQAAPAPVQPEYTQPATGTSDDDLIKLEHLGQLKDQGILTQAEFEAQKAKILHY
jgi:hypothetical protein